MHFILFSLLLASLPGQAAPISRSKVLNCESETGKFSAEVIQVRSENKRPTYEITISQKTSGAVVTTFPGAQDEDGNLNFRNSESYIPGYEQSFEIEKGTGLWTRSQSLDADQVLSFSCNR